MSRHTARAYIYLAYFTTLASPSVNDWTPNKLVFTPLEEQKLKYILQWTSRNICPFSDMGIGQKGFLSRNCSHVNCYVTSDKKLLLDYEKFDVIAFAGPELRFYKKEELPEKRSPHQKYVFASIESPANYPITCKSNFNDYFNWTWTYKLDSDLRWGYIVIRDVQGNIVGPKKEMHWMKREDMQPVPEALKKTLRGKTKLAAWFVSNCVSLSKREDFVYKLNKILQTKHNLTVDIYGKCGNLKCPGEKKTDCFKMIEKDYYFYLSFENSLSEDYVTEKLLTAVQNHAVPIVFGGANYSRFLSNGTYINAAELGYTKLAEKMHQLMNSFDEYVEYFRWTNHYTYHRTTENPQTNEYCKMCELLHNEEKIKEVSVYKDFKSWWNPSNALCYETKRTINRPVELRFEVLKILKSLSDYLSNLIG